MRVRQGITFLGVVVWGVVWFGLGSRPACSDGDVVELQEGVPREVRLPRGQSTWTARIEVPLDANALGVVASGSRDIDLYVRFGQPAEEDYPSTADAAAFSEAPHEVVRITPMGDVRLRPGAWFLTVENPFPRDRGVSFEVAAFVDRMGGRRTLLPGEPAPVAIPRPGRAYAIRTLLPYRATSAVVEIVPPVARGLRFAAEGRDGQARFGTAHERIILGRPEYVSGVYTLTFAAASRAARLPRLTARLRWTFAGGLVVPLPPSPLLEWGKPLPILMGGATNGNLQRLRIDVPPGNRGFILEARCALEADVDLYVRRGATPRRKDEDAEWLGIRAGATERLVVGGRRSLKPGIYHAEVVLVEAGKPVEVTVTLRPLPRRTGISTWGDDEPAVLQPDEWAEGVIRVQDAAIAWHAVHVPSKTSSLHAQLLDSSGPLELLLAREEDGGVLERAFTPLVDENLSIEFAGPLPADKRVLVGVVNRASWDLEVSYRLAVGFDRRPLLPPDLVWPPRIQRSTMTPAERTAAAAVEITIGDCSGGSGVCVSPHGHIVTCRHCLQMTAGHGRIQREGVIVAFSQELEAPPVQAFYAQILEEDTASDLVLLAPLRDVFDRPLPTEARFPWLPLGDSVRLRLGEPLWVAGYPQVGSDCTRTAVVLSRGIVSGLERRRGGPAWIKTDAWVAPGHSGGPLVDSRGGLVGVAAATLGRTESLGLAIPVSRIPTAWLDILAEHVPRAEGDEGGKDR